jgi:hypothetical protein
MAGSWKHFVDKKGRFKGSGLAGERRRRRRGARGGLRDGLVPLHPPGGLPRGDGQDAAALVEEAERAYRDGLRWSPGYTKKAAEQGIGRAEDWGQR